MRLEGWAPRSLRTSACKSVRNFETRVFGTSPRLLTATELFRLSRNRVSWCRFISCAQPLKRRDTDNAVAATPQSPTSRIERRCCLRGYKQQRKSLRMSKASTASALTGLVFSAVVVGLMASGSPVLAGTAAVHVAVPKVTAPPPVPKPVPAPVAAKVAPAPAAPALAPKAPAPAAPAPAPKP
jgi:hypothetical protein